MFSAVTFSLQLRGVRKRNELSQLWGLSPWQFVSIEIPLVFMESPSPSGCLSGMPTYLKLCGVILGQHKPPGVCV